MDFEGSDQDWTAALMPYGQVRDIAAGDSILLQGDLSVHIGIIISGHARASINTERGDETWVDQFGPDDFFGHVSLSTQASPLKVPSSRHLYRNKNHP